MAFRNKVRLPFYLSKPQYPAEIETYTKANGRRHITKANVFKELLGFTDYIPEHWHQCLTVALRHDVVTVVGQKYQGQVSLNGAYDIRWPEGAANYPIAQAEFKVFEEAFLASNTGCTTCGEAEPFEAVDDTIGSVEAGMTLDVACADNDTLCSNPVFAMVGFDSTYVESATINASGVMQLVLRADAPSVGSAPIATYRLTCGEASDTAQVWAGIVGAEGQCPPVSDLYMEGIPTDPLPLAYRFRWAIEDDVDSYGWTLVNTTTGATVGGQAALAGTATNVEVNGLDYASAYRFEVWKNCATGDSEHSAVVFTTPDQPEATVGVFYVNLLARVNDVSADGLSIGEVEVFAYFRASNDFDLTVPVAISGSVTVSDGGTVRRFAFDTTIAAGSRNATEVVAMRPPTAEARAWVQFAEPLPDPLYVTDASGKRYQVILQF